VSDASRYLQYKVLMSTSQASVTPYLQNITSNYTAVVTNSSGDYKYNYTAPSDGGSHNINVNTYFWTIFANATTSFTVTGTPSKPLLNAPGNNSYLKSVSELK